MKILVTGGLGFIGLNFVIKAHKMHDITVIDRCTYASNPVELLPDNVDFIHADICSINKIDMETDFEWIVHFAAESHVDNALFDATPFWHSNVQGTYEMTIFALRHNIKFFHVSTDEVFGEWRNGDPEFSEESPYRPNNMYAVSKAASDQIVRAQGRSFGLQYIITNCGNNYGPYQHSEKFIPRVLSGKPVELHASGKPVRDWIHVDDHVDAIHHLMFFSKLNESYVIGAGDAQNIERICEMAGAQFSYADKRPGVDVGYKLDPTKLEALGWEPKYKIEEYLHDNK